MNTSSPRAACRGGLIGKLLVFLVLLLAVAALAWAFFLPQIVTTALHKRTQFDVTVSELTANPFTSRVVIRGLVLRNPSSFPISDFVHVREFRAELNLPSLFSDRLVIEDAAINIEPTRRAGFTSARVCASAIPSAILCISASSSSRRARVASGLMADSACGGHVRAGR